MGEIFVDTKAKELGLSLENLAEEVASQLEEDIKNLAEGAYAKVIAEAQAKLNATRQDYLKGLDFMTLGENEYLIVLNGDFSNLIEAGWPPYDMRSTLLESKKTVAVGSRAGEPWVRVSKKGKRYAAVPIQQHPFSKTKGAGDLGQIIQSLRVENAQGKKQKITSIFRDALGKPLQGKVAMAKGTGIQNLENLTKYQNIYESGKVESIYIAYRMIGDAGSGWQNKGYSGAQIFSEVEMWVDEQLGLILQAYLGGV